MLRRKWQKIRKEKKRKKIQTNIPDEHIEAKVLRKLGSKAVLAIC